MVRRFLLGLILLGITTVTYGQEDVKEAKVTWDGQVSAIFRQRCVTCHNVNKKSGGLDISTYTNLMLGGSSGDVLEPGDAGSSYLFLLITHESEPFMPPNSDPIPANEISLVEKWINQGMPENAGSKVMVAKKPKFEMTLDPNATGKPETPPMPGRLNKAPNIYSPKRAAVTAIATNPWSSLTAVAGQKKISLYDVATMELLGVLDFPEGIAHVLKFSRNGSLLLAGGGIGSQSGKVVVYNVRNGERIFEVGDEFDVVLGADISADQSMIALGGPLKMIRVYSTATGDLMYETKKHTDWITKMEFSPDGVLLATGDRNGGMHVWEAHTGREYLTLKGHSNRITGISWRLDSNILSTGSIDGSVRLWEMEEGRQVKTWGAHGGGVTSLEFARDGRIVTTGRDRTAKIWNQDGAAQATYPAFADIALEVSFCDETNRIIAGDWTGKINVWKTDDNALVGELPVNPMPLETRLEQAQVSLSQAQAAYKPLLDASTTATAKSNTIKTNLVAANKKVTAAKAVLDAANKKIATYTKTAAEQDGQYKALIAAIAKMTPVIPSLTESVAKAKEAAGKNADDKELGELAVELEAALTKRTAGLAKVQADANSTKTQLDTTNSQLAASQKEATDAAAAMTAGQKEVAAITPMVKPAEEAAATALKAAMDSEAIVVSAQALVTKWTEEIAFTAKLTDVRTRLAAAFEALAVNQQQYAEMMETLGEIQKQYDTANQAVTTANTSVQDVTKRVTDAQAVAKAELDKQNAATAAHTNAVAAASKLKAAVVALGEAVAKSNEAVTKSGGDAELKKAAEALKTLTDKKTAEIPVADKAVADAQKALNSAKTVYADAQKAVISAEADLTTKKKLYSDAVAARKPHEEALASAKKSADTETKNVSDSEVALESIEAELTALQAS